MANSDSTSSFFILAREIFQAKMQYVVLQKRIKKIMRRGNFTLCEERPLSGSHRGSTVSRVISKLKELSPPLYHQAHLLHRKSFCSLSTTLNCSEFPGDAMGKKKPHLKLLSWELSQRPFSGGFKAFELWSWRRLESPSDCKEIQPVNAKGNQSQIFIERTDAEAETPILWPPDVKN